MDTLIKENGGKHKETFRKRHCLTHFRSLLSRQDKNGINLRNQEKKKKGKLWEVEVDWIGQKVQYDTNNVNLPIRSGWGWGPDPWCTSKQNTWTVWSNYPSSHLSPTLLSDVRLTHRHRTTRNDGRDKNFPLTGIWDRFSCKTLSKEGHAITEWKGETNIQEPLFRHYKLKNSLSQFLGNPLEYMPWHERRLCKTYVKNPSGPYI